jgi:hypothetical protein
MARMMLDSFPSGTLPVVALNRAFSKGFYSARTHVIVLDPDKNDGSDGLLDTLAFESGNALRRDDFLANAVLATQIEFDVTDRYLAMLLEATRSGGINSLVVALEIPGHLLTLADAPESLKAKKLVTADKKPAMPAPAVLPEQYKRTALAAFMQQEWSEGDRQKYFAISTHSVEDEMEATGEGYEVGPKGASVVSAVSGGGAARPASFRELVLAMVDEYPRATSAHFSALEPRHYGEFLLTGRVDKWHSEAPQEAPHVRQDLMLKVHRDLEQVYPNRSAWEPRMRDISLADLGEFVLNGKIRSWESG